MHQKMNVLDVFKYMSKRAVLKKKRKENLAFTILLSFLVIVFFFLYKKFHQILILT